MADDPQLSHNDRLIEEDASALYEEAPCGYLYTRPDGTLLRVNRTFLVWTGFAREELIGRRFQDLLSVGGRIFHETHLAPLLRMQGAVTEVSLDIVTRAGGLLPVLVNSVQKHDASGTPLLNRTTIFNVTDRRKYERELQLARTRAEESARTKSELLATISHDMRSPLGAILAAAQLLDRSSLTAVQQNYVRVLRSSSEGLLNLINNVLDLSRIESGRTAVERRPFDLRQLVFDVMAALNVRADEKQLSLRVTIDEAVPAAVIGDPVKIGQVLTNLATNAVKFTERGSVVLAVRLKGMTADRVDLEVSVADTGMGIPPDRLPHVFEEFTQASYDVGATYGGSGLGLAIVRRLIALLGSEISVQSTVGEGSVFSFSLGLGVIGSESTAGGDIGSDQAIAGTKLLGGLRVLLVEDNSFDVLILERALRSWGALSNVSTTIDDAIARMRTGRYDAVLLSTRVAGQGAESAATILQDAARSTGQQPQVLVLARSSAEAAGIVAGGSIAGVLHKPVEASVLFAKLAAGRK